MISGLQRLCEYLQGQNFFNPDLQVKDTESVVANKLNLIIISETNFVYSKERTFQCFILTHLFLFLNLIFKT